MAFGLTYDFLMGQSIDAHNYFGAHFVNQNGIHDENHYCTENDLYLIAKECQKYSIFN